LYITHDLTLGPSPFEGEGSPKFLGARRSRKPLSLPRRGVWGEVFYTEKISMNMIIIERMDNFSPITEE